MSCFSADENSAIVLDVIPRLGSHMRGQNKAVPYLIVLTSAVVCILAYYLADLNTSGFARGKQL